MGDPEHRFVRLAALIRDECTQLRQIVDEAAAAEVEFSDSSPPRLSLRGIGAVLHDFYTGIEQMFERIASELDGGLPAGSAWHRDLLQRMAPEIPDE